MEWPTGYVSARSSLRDAERALVEQQERVAAQRRALPAGPTLGDYAFTELVSLDAGDDGDVALADLVGESGRPLIMYHLMYGKRQATPCPMCTMWVDGINGVAHHVLQNADLAVIAAAGATELRAHARARGWNRLRLLSAGESTFKRDLGSEDDAGEQIPMVTVLTKDDGVVRLRYSATPELGDDTRERGIDAICATWELLDLTPQGRGDWYSSLSYD
jgi:predicted dithiol-disulfide oxidoreductase (DUF899 family)